MNDKKSQKQIKYGNEGHWAFSLLISGIPANFAKEN